MTYQHENLAGGRWFTLSLVGQLGNVGSEVGRAARRRGRDETLFRAAIDRALELLDLTIADPRWRGRLKEIVRVREVLCDAAFGEGLYQTSLEELDRYFFRFALAARAGR